MFVALSFEWSSLKESPLSLTPSQMRSHFDVIRYKTWLFAKCKAFWLYIIMSTKLFLLKTRFTNKIGWRSSFQFASMLSLLEISGIVHAHHTLQLKHQVLCMPCHTPCYRLGLKYGTQNIISMMSALRNCIGSELEVDNQSTHRLQLFIPNDARIISMYFFLRCNLFNFCLHVFPWQGFLSQQPIHSFWTLC